MQLLVFLTRTGKVAPEQSGSQVGTPKARKEKPSIVSNPLVAAHMKVTDHVVEEWAHHCLGEGLARQAQTNGRDLDIVTVQEF